ncbi:hypothetical protein [Mucilaginibacter panaciglaebae]|uniref:Uncharacterized protein n=1 Tax=Mucilaginibacter panaciglaebae TaxID=502331 RepID=A0ABP7WIL8_9SPHI
MKKTLGLIITLIGILIVVSAFSLTPDHALNPADSGNGISASAPLAYGGFITFGIGIVLYISSLPLAGEKRQQQQQQS